jgi:hypothetical protein
MWSGVMMMALVIVMTVSDDNNASTPSGTRARHMKTSRHRLEWGLNTDTDTNLKQACRHKLEHKTELGPEHLNLS